MSSSVQILWRILAVAVLSVTAYYIAFHTYFWLSAVWVTLVIVFLVWSILRIHRKGERDLENFLTAVAQHDFTTALPARIERDYPQQAEAYRTINKVYREISLSRESSQTFREVIVEHVGVALIGFRIDSGEITLINKVAKDLLNRPFLRNISALRQTDPELEEIFRRISSGERAMLSISRETQQLNLNIVARELVLDGYKYKLFAIQNIRSELEARETDSWIKLINVLTHEIKNSAIPIATLADAVAQTARDPDDPEQWRTPESLSAEDWQELYEGLLTITRRSKRLVSFVEAYGKFTRLPKPDLQVVDVSGLYVSVKELLKPALESGNIRLFIEVQAGLRVKADVVQLEQVFINLVKNASEAIGSSGGEIHLNGREEKKKVIMTVKDNGPGISAEALENIFIPFFTTKDGGTGIGLSICRQIILAHHGDIRVSSRETQGTEFEIVLPRSM